MCLITFAYDVHPDYRYILAANRDEFYARPTTVANWWEDHTELLGGRDLEAKGTWMAIHANGRFSADTNYRDIQNIRSDVRSRGDLPVQFLMGEESPSKYARRVLDEGNQYNGFNLLTFDYHQELAHVSNYDDKVNVLKPGIYGLSNALLDTPWPKVEKAKADFSQLIKGSFEIEDLIKLMQNTDTAPDEDLPETGLDYIREKALSAMCIRTPDYGTCCSTALMMDHDGNVSFMEKSYPVGDRKDETVSFNFKLKSLMKK